jgi:hypothetical protein
MSERFTPINVLYGGASKSGFEMNEAELEQAAISILRRAKEKAFSKGLPIIYVENRQLVAEYTDGHKELLQSWRRVNVDTMQLEVIREIREK